MPEKTRTNRDEQGKFIPGQSGNPNGRPKGSGLNLTALLKDKLEEIAPEKEETYKEIFIKTLLHKALIEKDLQSLKLIMNYVDGLPKQTFGLDDETKEQIKSINIQFNGTNDQAIS